MTTTSAAIAAAKLETALAIARRVREERSKPKKKKHYGPEEHPGTGSPQQAHGGNGDGGTATAEREGSGTATATEPAAGSATSAEIHTRIERAIADHGYKVAKLGSLRSDFLDWMKVKPDAGPLSSLDEAVVAAALDGLDKLKDTYPALHEFIKSTVGINVVAYGEKEAMTTAAGHGHFVIFINPVERIETAQLLTQEMTDEDQRTLSFGVKEARAIAKREGIEPALKYIAERAIVHEAAHVADIGARKLMSAAFMRAITSEAGSSNPERAQDWAGAHLSGYAGYSPEEAMAEAFSMWVHTGALPGNGALRAWANWVKEFAKASIAIPARPHGGWWDIPAPDVKIMDDEYDAPLHAPDEDTDEDTSEKKGYPEFDPDQPRDGIGRWADEGASGPSGTDTGVSQGAGGGSANAPGAVAPHTEPGALKPATDRYIAHREGTGEYSAAFARGLRGAVSQLPESTQSWLEEGWARESPFPMIREVDLNDPSVPPFVKDGMRTAGAATLNGYRIMWAKGKIPTEEALLHELTHTAYRDLSRRAPALIEEGVAHARSVGDALVTAAWSRQWRTRSAPENDADYKAWWGAKAVRGMSASVRRYVKAGRDDITGALELELMVPPSELRHLAKKIGFDTERAGDQWHVLAVYSSLARKHGRTINPNYTEEEPVAYLAGTNREYASRLFAALSKSRTKGAADRIGFATMQPSGVGDNWDFFDTAGRRIGYGVVVGNRVEFFDVRGNRIGWGQIDGNWISFYGHRSAKHYGPDEHPGTRSPQQAHAGDDGGGAESTSGEEKKKLPQYGPLERTKEQEATIVEGGGWTETSWNDLTGRQQDRVRDSWIEAHYSDEQDAQVEAWRENTDFREDVDNDADFAKATFDEWLAEQSDEFPFDKDSIRVSEGGEIDLGSLTFADDVDQIEMFPRDKTAAEAWNSDYAPEWKRFYDNAASSEAESRLENAEPPDFSDEIHESLSDSWDSMDDDDKMEYARDELGEGIASGEGKRYFESDGTLNREGRKWDTYIRDKSDGKAGLEDVIAAYSPGLPEGFTSTISIEAGPRINGKIFHDGTKIGHFYRTIHFDEKSVKHHEFFLEENYQDQGIGGLFSVAADEFYRKVGIEKVKLDAISNFSDKVTGHQVWAAQGFDWTSEEHASTIRQAINTVVENRYGKGSPEALAASKLTRASDFIRLTDSTGKKIGRELMHLGKLGRDSQLFVPSYVSMVREIGNPVYDRIWNSYAQHVYEKWGKKKKSLGFSMDELDDVIDRLNRLFGPLVPVTKGYPEFDPDQPRADDGKWSAEGGGGRTATAERERESPGGPPRGRIAEHDPIWKTTIAEAKKISDAPIEYLIVIDANGSVFHRNRGDETSVGFSDEPEDKKSSIRRALDGGVALHNHPYPGGSFSVQDIVTASKWRVREMVVVGSGTLYRMMPVEGEWPVPATIETLAWDAHYKIKKDFQRRIDAHELDREKAEVMHYHELWTRIAAKLGLHYERQERNDLPRPARSGTSIGHGYRSVTSHARDADTIDDRELLIRRYTDDEEDDERERKHYGPDAHPGTGSPQQVHAGGGDGMSHHGNRPKPIIARTIDEAIGLIALGKVVEIHETSNVVVLLDRLAEIALEAKRLGREAFNYDLCLVMLQGTSLFCTERVITPEFPEGIPRLQMPQLAGRPVHGSAADKLPRLKWDNTEVDAAPSFVEFMKASGIGVRTGGTAPVASLKASQKELVGTKVGKMMRDPNLDVARNPLIVSRDRYIVDGHHRWAAVVGRDAMDGSLGNFDVPVTWIDAPISEVLFLARAWVKDFGIAPYAAKRFRSLAHDAQHVRRQAGSERC